MTISPATKQLLVVGVLAIILLIAVVIQKKTATTSQPGTDTAPQTAQTTQSDVATLHMQRLTSTPATSSYRLALDTKDKQVNAISIRFRVSGSANASELAFVINPTLQESGWQVAINKANTSTGDDTIGFDLALINVQPNGGSVFTQDTSIGTFNAQPAATFALDKVLSMAATEGGGQLGLQLLQSE